MLLYGKLSFTIFLANLVPALRSSLLLKTKNALFKSKLTAGFYRIGSAAILVLQSIEYRLANQLSPIRGCIASRDKGFRQRTTSFCWLRKPLISQSMFKLSRPVHVRFRRGTDLSFHCSVSRLNRGFFELFCFTVVGLIKRKKKSVLVKSSRCRLIS